MQETLSFGLWLKDRRRVLGLTQQDLTQRAACSLSSLRKIEADELTPSRELALLLADALGIAATEQEAFVAFARDERRAALTPALVTTTALPPLHASLAVPPPQPPPAPSVPPRPTSLPLQVTPFIGRADEVDAVQQMLVNPACALLTLVGPGGIGKTRLALAVAQTILDFGFLILDSTATEPASKNPKAKSQNLSWQEPKFEDGLYFVSFAGVAASDLMVSTIATAIGFSFGGVADPRRQLLNYLAEKRMLLVLDNLEHLLEGVDLLAELVQAAPALKLLVTSRERLALQGEWVFELPALAAPQQNDDTAMVGDAAYPAVTLFVERAQRTRHGFTLDAENEASVGQICRLVGGMPLALELAASWLHALSCAEIAEEITRNLDFLTVSRRDLPERQRSVRATFDYSWRLLNEAERSALAQLSVFAGGFTREAAREVAETSITILGALTSKSLVRRVMPASSDATTAGKEQHSRYELHELLRQFAADKLAEEPTATAAAQTRHAHYYLRLLVGAEAALHSADQKQAQQRLQVDIANLHQAWAWAVAHEQSAWLSQAAWPFCYFFELCDDYASGEALFRWSQEALQAVRVTTANPFHDMAWASLATYQIYFVIRQSQRSQSLALLEEAIALLRRGADQKALALALSVYGEVCCVQGQFAASIAAIREAVALSPRQEQPWLWAFNQASWGLVLYELGDYQASYRLLAEAVAQARTLGNPYLLAVVDTFLARTLQALGRHDEMITLLQDGLRLARESGNRYSTAVALEQLAMVSHAQHQAVAYERFMHEALTLYRTIGDNYNLTRLLNQAGMIALAGANDQPAHDFFAEAIQRALAAQLLAPVLDALAGLAMLFMRQGDALLALTVVEAILYHPASPQATRERVGEVQQELLARLPAAQVETARQQAKATSLESLAAEVVKAKVG
ncbi:MAG: ATP-binding protein [Caldilineaceae bacterium]